MRKAENSGDCGELFFATKLDRPPSFCHLLMKFDISAFDFYIFLHIFFYLNLLDSD